MGFPGWAEKAFEKHKPQAAWGGDAPNTERLAWWQGCRNRFEKRWVDLEADAWQVPGDHACYGWLRRNVIWEPTEYVKLCILETVLDLAWDKSVGDDPEKVRPAVKELDALNEQISEAARNLAALFRQRDRIKLDHHLDDHASDYTDADPFHLWDAFEAAIELPHVRRWAYVAERETSAMLRIARTQSRPGPRWPDLLDQLAQRDQRPAMPCDAGDAAVLASSTNASEWSRWGRRLLGTLDDWDGTFPRGFLRDCLTNGQLATLTEVALDAPSTAFNADQMRMLKRSYERAHR